MSGHVTVEQPHPGVVRHHVGHRRHHRGEHDHVGAHVVGHHRLAVPVRRVNVPGADLVRVGEDVPPDPLALAHREHRAVALQVAVHGEEPVPLAHFRVAPVEPLRVAVESHDVRVEVPAVGLVEQAEVGDELTVVVLRRAVLARHAATRDDHRPDQPRVDVLPLVHVRVVEPERRAAVAVGRTGALGHRPGVDVRPTGWHRVVHAVGGRAPVEIRRALRALVVEHAVRVQRVRPRRVVAHHDADRVPDLGAQQGTENPEMLPSLVARLERAEGRVRVLAEARLAVRRGVGIELAPRAGLLREVVPLAGERLIAAAGDVRPIHLVGRDEIGPHPPPAVRGPRTSGRGALRLDHRASEQDEAGNDGDAATEVHGDPEEGRP